MSPIAAPQAFLTCSICAACRPPAKPGFAEQIDSHVDDMTEYLRRLLIRRSNVRVTHHPPVSKRAAAMQVVFHLFRRVFYEKIIKDGQICKRAKAFALFGAMFCTGASEV